MTPSGKQAARRVLRTEPLARDWRRAPAPPLEPVSPRAPAPVATPARQVSRGRPATRTTLRAVRVSGAGHQVPVAMATRARAPRATARAAVVGSAVAIPAFRARAGVSRRAHWTSAIE